MQGTQSKTESDFCLEDHGSILLLRPLPDAAEEWVDENIGEGNGFQPYRPTVVIEPRYVADILEGARLDGLAVRG